MYFQTTLAMIMWITSICRAQDLIKPTYSDSNSEYYIRSHENQTYENSLIICSKDICHIIYNATNPSSVSTPPVIITAAPSTIIIECLQKYSCVQLTAEANSVTKSLALYCNAVRACFNMVINAQYANELNVSSSAWHAMRSTSACTINARNAKKVNIMALHTYSDFCNYNLQLAGTINLYFDGHYAFLGEIDAVFATSVTANFVTPAATSNLLLKISSDVSTAVINCYGFGCKGLTIDVDSQYISQLVTNVYSCSSCNNAAECLSFARCDPDCTAEFVSSTTFYDTNVTNECGIHSRSGETLQCSSNEVEIYYENGDTWQNEWYANYEPPNAFYDEYYEERYQGCYDLFCIAFYSPWWRIDDIDGTVQSPMISTVNYTNIKIKYTMNMNIKQTHEPYPYQPNASCSVWYSINNGKNLNLIQYHLATDLRAGCADLDIDCEPTIVEQFLHVNTHDINNLEIYLKSDKDGALYEYICYIDEIRICGREIGPTFYPTSEPSQSPIQIPTLKPTYIPTSLPTKVATQPPSFKPTGGPTLTPTSSTTETPTKPTNIRTHRPTKFTKSPTVNLDVTTDESNMETTTGTTETWVWVVITVAAICCIVTVLIFWNMPRNAHVITIISKSVQQTKDKCVNEIEENVELNKMNRTNTYSVHTKSEGFDQNVEWMSTDGGVGVTTFQQQSRF